VAHLAILLDLDTSSTAGLIDRAQRLGQVRRVEVPEGLRAVLVGLTTEGRQFAEALVTEIGRPVNCRDRRT
jgi:DNA-binding MarR family transcriptional regulator